jgi:hypothetical protein
VDRDGWESLDEEINGGGRWLLWPLGREEERVRKREKQAREGREEEAVGDLIPTPRAQRWQGSPRWINGAGSDTQELSVGRKTTTKGRWAGPSWVLAGKGEGKSWAGNGPRKGRVPFFKNLFLIYVSQNPLLFYKKIL